MTSVRPNAEVAARIAQHKAQLEHWRASRREPDLHDCVRGPVCGQLALAQFLGGDKRDECPHASCHEVERSQWDCQRCWYEGMDAAMSDGYGFDDLPMPWHCPTHGWTMVKWYGTSSGFAGGRVDWTQLACGCFDVDESDDLRAAE